MKKHHLFTFMAGISGVIIWICALTGRGSDVAIGALLVQYLVAMVVAYLGQVHKYKHINALELKRFSLTTQGVEIEMKNKESESNEG